MDGYLRWPLYEALSRNWFCVGTEVTELLMISETIASQINQLLYVVAQALAALTWFACWLHGQAYSTMYHEAGWVL